MGFFDRFSSKKETTPPAPANDTSSAPQPVQPAAPAPGSIQSQLLAANQLLKENNVQGAVAIYDELLRAGGDRADVLVTISADLGTAGHIEQIVELVAPRYDAERHGPATGINLVQAYLALRNTTAAQHVLDVLFALERPELEMRLHGFSNALAELIEAEKRGELPPPGSVHMEGGSAEQRQPGPKMINLVSISRPVWAYGLDNVPGVLPPPKQDKRLRRVAFAQISTLGITTQEAVEKSAKPEDELARFTRGFPLWMAETFYFSPHYTPIAALALMDKDHYAIFPVEWTTEHLHQLVSTSGTGLDYVFTGALLRKGETTEMLLRLWEVKKMRERKQFKASWTAETADAELAKLHEQIRVFMEWQVDPAGPKYEMPATPMAWCESLGTSLSFFLVDKATLPESHISDPEGSMARVASRAAGSEKNSLTWLTLRDRASRTSLAEKIPANVSLVSTPLVEQAKQELQE